MIEDEPKRQLNPNDIRDQKFKMILSQKWLENPHEQTMKQKIEETDDSSELIKRIKNAKFVREITLDQKSVIGSKM